jgi:tetratricopeptide (TPR) repeat protein
VVGFLTGFLFTAVSPAATQMSSNLDPILEEAILTENWEMIVSLLPKKMEPNLPAPLRLVKGHACLATNRNNESLCLFLEASSETDHRRWKEWSTKFLKQHPSNPIAYYLCGDANSRLRQWGPAIAYFDKGCVFDPNHALLRNARGVAFVAMGQAERSFEDFLAATENSPYLADAFANLGTYALQVKDGAKGGIKDYDKAIALSTEFALAFFGRGCLRIASNDFEVGQRDLDRSWDLAQCSRPFFLRALAQAREAAEDANIPEVVVANGAEPGFAVSSGTLDKFSRGDFGFNGWALQNALKNARNSTEVDAITRSVNKGLQVKPLAGPSVSRDYAAVENWALRKGTIDQTISNWKISGQGLGATAGPGGVLSGRIGGNIGGDTLRDFSRVSTKYNNLADSIGGANLLSPNGSPQGFKASPPLDRDHGNWPFRPIYGLGYHREKKSMNSQAQVQLSVEETEK